MDPRNSRSPDLIPIDVAHLDRLVAALGLVDASPGRQIRRDARGWKETELQLTRILIGAIRPSFLSPISVASAVVDGSCLAAVLLAEDVIGPTKLDNGVLDAVITAWPAPGAWSSEGWITLDGTEFDLMLSSLGASTRLQFTTARAMDELSTAIGLLLAAVANGTGSDLLRTWLSDRASFSGRPER